MKKALITGITGQDGSYLSELLLEKGYEVHGIVRRVTSENPKHRYFRLNHVLDKVNIDSASLESYASIFDVVEKVRPDECYHLGAQSFVKYSFEDSHSTYNTNINGTNFILTSLKEKAPRCKFYFAGTSEMFGKAEEVPQSEKTLFHPRSPYGISKVAGFDLTRYHREAYDMFACTGILFNHESPRRGFEFVTRKITDGAAKIKLGLEKKISLGNIDAKRDWGHSKDYVKAMWMMLQQDKPEDYVIATNETHTIREFVNESFNYLGMKLHWEGEGDKEKAYLKDGKNWRNILVDIAKEFYRPADVELLKGDYSKAKRELGWEPRIKFEELVREMIDADVSRLKVIEEIKGGF